MNQKSGNKYKLNNHPTGKRSAARRASIIMPEALWAKLKLISIERRTTINDLVVEAMTEKYGKASESEVRQVIPGTKRIVELPPAQPVIPQRVVNPWENCVINTHFAIEVNPPQAHPKGKPEADVMQVFRKAFRIRSGNSGV